MVRTDEAPGLISSGGLAAHLGVSLSSIKAWEAAGRIAPALRISGSGRRAWRVTDLPVLERQVSELLGDRRRKDRAAA
ncbi:MAG: hypothetical protein M3Q71_06010 [Chloroflexota bacterium]|nr:hypothetical protein [Chloroflexota bacterium]